MRSIRVGFAAAVVAAAGIAVAACGPGGVPGAAGAAPSTTTKAATPGDAIEAAYTSTTSAGTAKITIDMAMTVQGTKIDFGGNGEMDFAKKTGDLTINAMGTNMETRIIDGIEYLHLPTALTGQVKTKPWVKLDVNKAVQAKFGASLSELAGGASNDPSQILSYLQGVGSDVKNDGPATVDGTATTHYTATMSLDALAQKEHLSQDTIASMEKDIGKTMTLELWLDGQNRLRQMSYNQTVNPDAAGGSSDGDQVGPITANMTMKLSDFGTPVNVTAPPADQVTDLN